MADRYETHIIGCLKSAIENAVDGVECHISAVTVQCAIDLLKERPQIVRCKDCFYWDKGHTEECDNSDSVCFHNGWCKPDWFCADGEQKDGDDA